MSWYGRSSPSGPGPPHARSADPAGLDYLPLAVGGVLIALFSLEKLVRLHRRTARPPASREPRSRAVRGTEPWNSGFSSASSRSCSCIGTPVAFCLGIASLATVLYMGLPPIVVFQQIDSGMNAFAMMAIPFFIYAGDLMMRGGIAERLIRIAAGLVGHLRGGLGQVNVVASTLFGGVSGSAIADASAIGGIMIPQMGKRGYDRGLRSQRDGERRRSSRCSSRPRTT